MADLLNHFAFQTIPFTCEIDTSKRCSFDFCDEVLAELITTVERRMSAALIGPAGTGKTFLIRQLYSHLPEARYRVRYMKVTDLSKRDMCREIATVVGAPPVGTYPALVRTLQETFVSSMTNDGLRPVLLIDEGHDMRPSVLGVLRLLTNFEMDSRLVVSIILSGQPPLLKLLKRNTLTDVAQRLAYCGTLRLLTREEVTTYVNHRLVIAGGQAEWFARDAVEAIHEISRGNLRAIDFLALRSLQRAADNDKDVVDANQVMDARSKMAL
ncbi:ExeA family protein [candidate division CSSED10-310 bacterium]|uniref:ExeA family protein n=1 Tax=candidate division CSSED10-310 bacterium TaxID=2855610 RepID=A0ABV6Z1A4_UNCC1